jgi:VIT1/CCC1 family predicted Fe2+/Mn2+ transporter
MAVGNFLAIRARESARAAENLPAEEARPIRHGAATFMAFVGAGAVPLAPYVWPALRADAFPWSVGLTLASLFAVGALRTTVTLGRWWVAGLEMLSLGILVAAVAYGAGAAIAALLA